jgi:hypothetical protein
MRASPRSRTIGSMLMQLSVQLEVVTSQEQDLQFLLELGIERVAAKLGLAAFTDLGGSE